MKLAKRQVAEGKHHRGFTAKDMSQKINLRLRAFCTNVSQPDFCLTVKIKV